MKVRCRNASNCCELTCPHLAEHHEIPRPKSDLHMDTTCVETANYFCGCNSEGEYVLDGRCIPVQSAAVLGRNDEGR